MRSDELLEEVIKEDVTAEHGQLEAPRAEHGQLEAPYPLSCLWRVHLSTISNMGASFQGHILPLESNILLRPSG